MNCSLVLEVCIDFRVLAELVALVINCTAKGKNLSPNSVIVYFIYLFFFFLLLKATNPFLCQLICQSADIMASLCAVCVCARVCMINFSTKSTRPRDILFVLKGTLSIEDENLFKACRSVSLSVP